MSKPAALLTQRAVVHRPQANGHLHNRCSGGRTVFAVELSSAELLAYVKDHSAVLCRYRWCFRDVVREAGLDTFVGHRSRYVRRGAAFAKAIGAVSA